MAELSGSWKNALNAQLRRLGYEIRRTAPTQPPRPLASSPTVRPDESSLPKRGATGFAARRAALEALDGMTPVGQLKRLYELARRVEEGCIVEVGSYRGRSTVALAYGSLDGHKCPIFAIEPHERFTGVFGGRFGPRDRAAFFKSMLATGAWEIVRLVNVSSEVVTQGWTLPVGLLWLDGDHSYEGVSHDYRCWERHLLPGTVLALDDTRSPDLGPARLVAELVDGGRWRVVAAPGKMTVLRQPNNGEGAELGPAITEDSRPAG